LLPAFGRHPKWSAWWFIVRACPVIDPFEPYNFLSLHPKCLSHCVDKWLFIFCWSINSPIFPGHWCPGSPSWSPSFLDPGATFGFSFLAWQWVVNQRSKSELRKITDWIVVAKFREPRLERWHSTPSSPSRVSESCGSSCYLYAPAHMLASASAREKAREQVMAFCGYLGHSIEIP